MKRASGCAAWVPTVLVLWCVASARSAPPEPPPATTAPADGEKITAVQAAVLGVVEGLTEYLPVSSTGHLILTSRAMGLGRSGELRTARAVEAFEIVIQLGAILAVVGLYRRRVGQMFAGLAGRNARGLRLLGLLAVAFVPSAIVGVLLHRPIQEYLFTPGAVSLALAIGGALMIVWESLFEKRRARSVRTGIDAMTFRQALIIGLAQCASLWPGTSRSMVTILAALAVGLDRLAAAEFSFLLALPTLTAATLYEGAKSHQALLASAGPEGLIIGLLVSAVVAALAVRGFVAWLTRHGLMPFGIYRILLACAVYFYFLTAR